MNIQLARNTQETQQKRERPTYTLTIPERGLSKHGKHNTGSISAHHTAV